MSSMKSNLEGFSMDVNRAGIMPQLTKISKSRSKRKSRNSFSPDHSSEMNITFSHHENNVGIYDGMPLDPILLQESLLFQEQQNNYLTNDQYDSFNTYAGPEHGLLANSPLVEMLSTPLMKIEEDAEN